MMRRPAMSRLARMITGALGCALALMPRGASAASDTPKPQARVIEVVADHDSRFKIPGQKKAEITVVAGEALILRITAVKAKSMNRDGSVHGFTLLRTKDRVRVPGWDLLLMPGIQTFNLTAPAEPGEYEVVCTVICSSNHDYMNMRLMVVPPGQ